MLRIFHCTWAKWPYFHFWWNIWHHRRVPWPRFPKRHKNFGNSAINKSYIEYFSLHKCKTAHFHFQSKIWCSMTPISFRTQKNFGDLHKFKADIGLLNICMGFQDLLAQNGGFGGKIREGMVRHWPLMNSLFLLGDLRLCQFWWKSIKKCDRKSARRRAHRLTDRCKRTL